MEEPTILIDYCDSLSAITVLLGSKWLDWWEYKVGMFQPFYYSTHWN